MSFWYARPDPGSSTRILTGPGGHGGSGGRRKEGRTEARDVQGKRLRLTRNGLAYGEEFVPLDEVDGTRPASDVLWNPATKLFEVSVFRRHGPPLAVKNLPPRTADLLRKAMIDALGGRRA